MRTPLLLLVSSLAISTGAAGQTERRVGVFAGGGIAVPNAPDFFRDLWKEGFDLMLGVGFPLASKLTLQGTVSYERFPIDRERFLVDYAGGEAEILSFSGEVRFRFIEDFDRVSPYLVGGAGVARVSTRDLTPSFSPTTPYDLFTYPAFFDPRFYGVSDEGFSETTPMTTFGGGVDIPFTESAQFLVEGRYQMVFPSDTSDVILSRLAFSESTAHWTIRGGLRFAL